MSKISQGLRGAAVEEGLQFPLGNLSLMCPLASQGKALSPQGRRAPPDGILGAEAQCTPCSCRAMLGGTLAWCTFHRGLARSQGAGAWAPTASRSELLSLCQAVPGLSAQASRTLRRWAGLQVLLSSSLAPPQLPTVHLAKGPAHSEGPSPTPVPSLGAVVEKRWGPRSSSRSG